MAGMIAWFHQSNHLKHIDHKLKIKKKSTSRTQKGAFEADQASAGTGAFDAVRYHFQAKLAHSSLKSVRLRNAV
jgi:hypothetical protein